MLELMDYENDMSFDEFDPAYDDEADEWLVGGALGMGLGAATGGLAGGAAYDLGKHLLGRYGGARGKRWSKNLGKTSLVRDIMVNAGAGIGGGLGGGVGLLAPVGEEEYESDAIEDMEALMEIALEGDSEDAEQALDSMVLRAFGPIRAAANMRRIMAAVRQKVAALVARARRDPRYQAAARVAPTVLRRTAVKLLKMVAAGRNVTVEIALRVFAGELARVLQSSGNRKRTIRNSRVRASRSLARHRATARMY